MQIGNAVINDETDEPGMYDYLATHAIISDRAAYDINNSCDFTSSNQTRECNAIADEVSQDISYIDLYNIYAPLCKDSNLTALPKKTSVSSKFQRIHWWLIYRIILEND